MKKRGPVRKEPFTLKFPCLPGHSRKGRCLPIALAFLVIAALTLSAGCDKERITAGLNEYEKGGGKLQDARSLAVLGLGGLSGETGSAIAGSLTKYLRSLGYFTVKGPDEALRVAGGTLPDVQKEIAPEKAVELAGALGVDFLICGKAEGYFFSDLRFNRDLVNADTTGYSGIFIIRGYCPRRFLPVWAIPRPFLHRQGSLAVTLQVIDGYSGRVAATVPLFMPYDYDYMPESFYYNEGRRDGLYWFDRLKKYPMPRGDEMLAIMADRLFEEMRDRFIPCYISKVRALQEGPGTDLARQGAWEKALNVWKETLSSHGGDWKLLTNMGIAAEHALKPSEASTFYEKAIEDSSCSPVVKDYLTAARKAEEASRPLEPLGLTQGSFPHKIAEVKEDGRVYLDAGEEADIRPGDRYMIARYRTDFARDLVTPKGGYFYLIGYLTIEKTYRGVSKGTMSSLAPGILPRRGDSAALCR
ncbi:MAG: hypothetical protein RDV48_21590 [Candidatus Eremiobacteraeota bacterium]|nr:hypothetical protein [Candidatus Eremiobacteraeota bacterium]